jgi:hypothetical protein
MNWEAALDIVEERVRAQEQAIAHFSVIPNGELPAVDGPLPQHLALRAMALLARSRDVEAQIGEHLHRLRSVRHPT